jgi:hypothetical protein
MKRGGLEPKGLFHINLCIDIPVQECCSDIKLSDVEIFSCSYGEYSSNRVKLCNRTESLLLVNAWSLGKALRDKAGFEATN